jgi:hypothetical protein
MLRMYIKFKAQEFLRKVKSKLFLNLSERVNKSYQITFAVLFYIN